MHADYFLDRVPILLFFAAFVLIALLPIETVQRLGASRRRRTDHEPHKSESQKLYDLHERLRAQE